MTHKIISIDFHHFQADMSGWRDKTNINISALQFLVLSLSLVDLLTHNSNNINNDYNQGEVLAISEHDRASKIERKPVNRRANNRKCYCYSLIKQ